MLGNRENRVAVPLCIYAVTAIWCWLTPSRLMIDDMDFALNIFPTKALALATVALAIVHWAFALRGRVVVSVASLWAVATTWMVTMFIIFSHWQTVLAESVVRLVHILTVAAVACGLCILAWRLVRRRHLAVDANWIARGLVVLGLAGLAFNYATVAHTRRVERAIQHTHESSPLASLGRLWSSSSVRMVALSRSRSPAVGNCSAKRRTR